MLRLLVAVLGSMALALAASGAQAERGEASVPDAPALLLAQAQPADGSPAPAPFVPPKRGAPDGRVGGASRDIGPKAHRLALVIGNDVYQNVPVLSKAVADANAVAAALRKLGFTVTVAQNQSRQAMSETLLNLDSAVQQGDTVFFFFAGHGFEIRGTNYLLPIDVPAAAEGQEELVQDDSFPVDNIISRLQARGARTTILVLDACRNNPFPHTGTRSIGGSGGLASVTPPEGVFILFSAGAKQTALDAMSPTDPDPDSVFTRNFVRELARPGLTIVDIAKHTQAEVKQLAAFARHDQTPAYYDQIVGDFVLNPGPGEAPERTAAALVVPRPEALAPSPAPPAAPRPAPAQPINAPFANFMRSNSGWTVSLSFVDPVIAISWRLGEKGPFKETGFLDTLDSRTRRRMVNPSFELDPDTPASVIYVRAVDLNGNTAGPFPIKFDPAAEVVRGERRALDLTAGSWVMFRNFNGLLLYYTQLMSFRCAIREVRIGIDNSMPDKVIKLPPCDPAHPQNIPANARPYLQLPPKTQMVTVELTYADGSVSETKTFRKTAHLDQ
ncbi:MAG TPA: caspase family protein [Stellaceae bacterium]|nr:caspase family protein [Stellaceae bacterium]